jgi:uncharacterized membrane protein
MSETNVNARLETFCDGVFAIAMTLLIIDIKIPSTAEIHTVSDFWNALGQIIPSISAFVLSFVIILITWVNHHNAFKLVNKSTNAFIYANGLLLLTVVFIPFPTSLVGEYLLTDHAAPAVVLYNAIGVVQSLGWVLIGDAALKGNLMKSEKAREQMRLNRKSGYFAIIIYSMMAILAFWFPLLMAIATAVLWIFWLIYGINMKQD